MRSILHTVLHALLAMTVVLATGCSTRSLTNAPVEDRGTGLSRPTAGAVIDKSISLVRVYFRHTNTPLSGRG